MKRKTVSIRDVSDDDWSRLTDFCKEMGITMSEFIEHIAMLVGDMDDEILEEWTEVNWTTRHLMIKKMITRE